MVHVVCVVGLGYVGFPSAMIFAYKGFNTIGIDVDSNKVSSVNKGVVPIKEPRLEEILRDSLNNERFYATTDYSVVRDCDAVLFAVPTPVSGVVADLSYLVNALEGVKKYLRKGHLVVIESTVPPGTTSGLAKSILEGSGLRVEEDFYLAHVPERIAPGRAVEELLNIPRVVGGVGPRSTERAVELYSKVNPRLYPTDATTAEFVKLSENTFRDLNIAFANLLALIAERLGVDVYEAIRLANTHPRVNIHWPGAGVGGLCLTKDPYMLASLASDLWAVELIKLARRINEYMPRHMVELIERALTDNGVNPAEAKIVVLGTAYKGGVDDTRESPAKYIIGDLLRRRLKVVTYDPYTTEAFGAERAGSLEEAVQGADVVVIVTDHPEFKNIDLEGLAKLMRRRIIVDGRRVVDPYNAYRAGFRYYGVGFGKAFKI